MRGTIFLLIGVFCLVGCESLSKRHATRAILFSPASSSSSSSPNSSSSSSSPIQFVPSQESSLLYSGNPVFIHNNTKFSIRIDEVNPGWIYRAKPTDNASSKQGGGKSGQPATSKLRDPISEEQFNHFRGHELWLLTTISSVNVNDPLETKSKRYFKATNVKFDSQSYSLIPLDSEEKYIFTHESDSSYRVTFQLFKVNQFALKRELAKIGRNPGVVGAGKALLETFRNTAGALVGDVLQSVWEEKASEGLALERFLLSIEATEEFHGELIVLRNGDFQNRDGILTSKQVDVIMSVLKNDKDVTTVNNYALPRPFLETPYVFLDYFKYNSSSNANEFSHYDEDSKKIDPYSILNEVAIAEGRVIKDKKPIDLKRFGYMKFSVLQSHSAKSYIDEDGKIRSSQVPETYVNILASVENILNTKSKAKVENEISQLNTYLASDTCKVDTKCQADTKEMIKKMRIDALEDNTIEELKGAYEAYKNNVKLGEWRAHLTRQPD